MLSSDKNVESIAQLVETLQGYLQLQKEYLKFDIIEKVVRLVTALSLVVVVFVLLIAILFYLSFAAVYWMAPATGTALAFFLVALFFIAMLLLVIAFRKPWIERPLVRFLASTLLD